MSFLYFLNVSFGIYAFLPQGWMFMLSIIILECFVFTLFQMRKLYDRRIYSIIVISNIISGLIGIVCSMILNGGWWLVVWFPWVSRNEVKGEEAIVWLIYFYLIAFILTLIIEIIINHTILRKEFHKTQIIKNTFFANALSYLIGSIVFYTYSF